MQTIIVALGGNALLQKGQKSSITTELKNLNHALDVVVDLALQGKQVIVTHGNGPQVGNILIRSEQAKGKAYEIPLDVAVAQSQGEIGYLMQLTLENKFKKKHKKIPVAVLVSQFLVDAKDSGFKHPSKPIGPFFAKPKPDWKKNKTPFIEDSGKGYRRVVASPMPLKALEIHAIETLLKKKFVVITAGGGGIPVVQSGNNLKGVEAVIDKDKASAVLGKQLHADSLLIVTDVPFVYTGYQSKQQKALKHLSVKETKQLVKNNEFGKGSMKPKIEAAIHFLENGGKTVIITSLTNVSMALKGKTGTTITR